MSNWPAHIPTARTFARVALFALAACGGGGGNAITPAELCQRFAAHDQKAHQPTAPRCVDALTALHRTDVRAFECLGQTDPATFPEDRPAMSYSFIFCLSYPSITALERETIDAERRAREAEKKAADDAVPAETLTFKPAFDSASGLEATDDRSMTVHFFSAAMHDLVIEARGWPEGTTVDVGGKTYDASGVSRDIQIDVGSQLPTLLPSQLAKVDPHVTMTIARPASKDHPKARAELAVLPVSFEHILRASSVENAIKAGPIVFGREPTDDPRLRCALMPTGNVPVFVPRPCRLGEIDTIVILSLEGEPRGTLACGEYHTFEGDFATDRVTVNLYDTKATVYDRRTGAIVEQRTLPPRRECPQYISTEHASNDVNYRAAEAWLRAGVR